MHEIIHNPKIQNVLLSPLDWGLGHTTRCFPLIEALILENKNIYIACQPGSASEKVLKLAFPQLNFLDLKGYSIRYAKSKNAFKLRLFLQLPKILMVVYQEHKKVKKWIDLLNIHLVISDNRFGFYSKKVKSVFITHQLQILMPRVYQKKLARLINYAFINRFSECWVPDFKDVDFSIAGKLSHPKIMPRVPVRYIGPQNRLKDLSPATKKYKLMILLSGPEPQRTLLEQKLLKALEEITEPTLLVRGLPRERKELPATKHLKIINFLQAESIAEEIAASEFILARSGYTSVMEMFALHKKCIYVPTPGQAEQEYLAKRFMKQRRAFSFAQSEKNYVTKIREAFAFGYHLPYTNS